MRIFNPAVVPHVLVVEDDELLRMTAVDLVCDQRLKAFEADSADQALEMLSCHCQIGILFTDIEMPGSMDGLALAHTAKRHWPHLQHIIVSGNVLPKETALPERASFFAKPYNPNLIGKALRVMAGLACEHDCRDSNKHADGFLLRKRYY
ncbi:MAG: response regulator [Sphingomonadales bacterium]|nr:response regulator [Sphingomonadales bacterium]